MFAKSFAVHGWGSGTFRSNEALTVELKSPPIIRQVCKSSVCRNFLSSAKKEIRSSFLLGAYTLRIVNLTWLMEKVTEARCPSIILINLRQDGWKCFPKTNMMPAFDEELLLKKHSLSINSFHWAWTDRTAWVSCNKAMSRPLASTSCLIWILRSGLPPPLTFIVPILKLARRKIIAS